MNFLKKIESHDINMVLLEIDLVDALEERLIFE